MILYLEQTTANYHDMEALVCAALLQYHLPGQPKINVERLRLGDIHTYIASLLFQIDEVAVTSEQRGEAKAFFFRVVYGTQLEVS
jgi:DNA polymerase I-like protein with 3'-5' exonuclease and polymerase domains